MTPHIYGCCDRCNADNIKAVLVELPSADVTTTADSVGQQAVAERDENSSRRLSRHGNSVSRSTARSSQQQQQQQQQQQPAGHKQDSETSEL